jgi:alkyl sulfatase BDS1-like metallo-beta-lactamase superfamily hydrolase
MGGAMAATSSIRVILCALQFGWVAPAVRAQAAFGNVEPNQVADFLRIGQDQTEALKVNEAIYQGIGFANTFLITTPGGNVIVDTSSAHLAQKHHDLLTKVSDAPVRYIILTHGHGDHTGGVHLWKQEETQILTQRNFPTLRAYQDRLGMYFARTNAAQFNFNAERLAELGRSPQSKVEPTITFDQRFDFELAGVKFEVYHTPGETYDALTVWVPKYKAAFVGDNVYDSFPNIYTLRGTQPRWALDYVASINKVLALEPEIVLPSHGLPIVGKEKIVKRLTQYRNAIQFVHDAVVKGMNDGKDVFTLMREIKLPPQLDIGETYGKVSWSVRGIYEGYVGWFDSNPATMYSASPNVADADLVDLAGGPSAVAAKARDVIKRGDAVRGLRLAEAALARDPAHREALEAKLTALEALQKKTRNGLEHAWLGYGMRGVQKLLEGPTDAKPESK